jgi:hypothetical protein
MRTNTKRCQQSLSLAEAIAKACTAAKTIELRGNVKPHEHKRIKTAFDMIKSDALDTMDEKKKAYDLLLRRLYASGGASMVTVCIVGLGGWALSSLREKVKLHLPENMVACRANWDTERLRSVAQECWMEG